MNLIRWIKSKSQLSITGILLGLALLLFAILNLTDSQLILAGPNVGADAKPITLFDDLPHLAGWLFLIISINTFALNLPFSVLALVFNPLVRLIVGGNAIDNINKYFAQDEIKRMDKLAKDNILYKTPDSPSGYRISESGVQSLQSYLEEDARLLLKTGIQIKEYREKHRDLR